MGLPDVQVELRVRSAWQALDLGAALLRRHARILYASWLLVSLPLLLGGLWPGNSLWWGVAAVFWQTSDEQHQRADDIENLRIVGSLDLEHFGDSVENLHSAAFDGAMLEFKCLGLFGESLHDIAVETGTIGAFLEEGGLVPPGCHVEREY